MNLCIKQILCSAIPVYPWVAGFSSLPTHGITQTTQSISMWEPRATLSSWYYEVCLPQPLLVYSTPKRNPLVALCDMRSSPPWVYMTKKLLSISYIYTYNPMTHTMCHVSSHSYSQHQWGEEEVNKTGAQRSHILEDGWVPREKSRWFYQKMGRNAGKAQTTGVQ